MAEITAHPVGRPREFDAAAALDAALDVFWSYGYDGASLALLTQAMGINKTSMYRAFGNKRQLFDRAFDHYADRDMAYVRHALAQPTAALVIETFLRDNVVALTTPGRPPGCFSLQGGVACGPENADVAATLAQRRRGGEQAMADRLHRAQDEGDLAAVASPDDMARYIMSLSEGMAVHASSGASRDELERVVELALRGLTFDVS